MVRIGIIGAGNNGAGHARYYHRSPRSEVVAVADPVAERASALAGECGARATQDYREFLADVDAVVISSPNHVHRDHAVECARAGRHVYCEKPMGLSAGQAAEIASAIREAGVRSVIGFSVRFSDTVQTMQRYLREGRLGELISIWSRRLFFMDLSKAAEWRRDPALSGGLLFEINVHEVEWMMALGGELESVYARTYAERPQHPRANDHIWVVMNFANGVVGTHEGSQISPVAQFDCGLLGTVAGMETAEWGKRLRFAKRGAGAVEVKPDPEFDLRGHFLDCVEEGIAGVADAEWGLTVMTAADAILESASTGRVVGL